MGYHPTVGRWIERDPGPVGAPAPTREYADGMNLYQYGHSAPTETTDPSGLYVTASLHEDHIMMEVGITLWSPWESEASDYFMRKIKENIERGMQLLEEANKYKVCHTKSQKVYPVRWGAKVELSYNNHWFSKPGNSHYVEVRDNRYYLGVSGGHSAFSPSISTKNNKGGWGVWDYKMGANMSDTGVDISNENAAWAAHETLHFAGLWDQYNWLKTDEVKPGFENNIMGGQGQWDLKPWQMEVMLKDRLKGDLGWTLNVDYEITK